MIRRALALSLVLLASATAPAAANPWSDRSERTVAREGAAPQLRPTERRLLRLDTAGIDRDLQAGRVQVPDPDGGFTTFAVEDAPVLAPADAARHPELRTYRGTAVGDPATTAALDRTPQGFHATVRGPAGSWSVDPYTATTYAAYPSGALPRDARFEAEGVEASGSPLVADLPRAGGAAVTLRTLRLALISDSTFADKARAAAPGATSAQAVLGAKTTLVNRVDQVYEQDLGIRLQLNASNALNLDTTAKETSAPGYAAGDLTGCKDSTLTKTTPAITSRIGAGSYDVGHIVLAGGSGGLATLGVVGDTARKGSGCTARTAPTGDAFAIDYLAHELGHQFDADHTFNGTDGSCSGNRAGAAAVEPGSGSSVMAYAGICGDDNLQPHSDPYFSQRSITQIRAFVDGQIPTVGTRTATGDSSPAVTAPADAKIPPRTPFRLTATGSDADGDAITYSWEENDTGAAASLFGAPGATGPLFRIFSVQATDPTATTHNLVTTDPTRTFPDLDQIVAGRTNAAGTCAAASDLDCASEKLPVGPRTLTFRVTARDGLGGLGQDDVKLTVTGTTPLTVSSQPTDETAAGASTATVTWTPVALGPLRVRFLTTAGEAIDLAINLPDTGTAAVRLPPGRTGPLEVGSMAGTFFDLSDGVVTTDGTPDERPPAPFDPTAGAVAAAVTASPPPATPAPPAAAPVPAPATPAATAPLCGKRVLVTGATRRGGVVRLTGLASAPRVRARAGRRSVRTAVRRGRWSARIETATAATPVRVAGVAGTVRLDRLVTLRRKGSRLVGRGPRNARLVITRRTGCGATRTLARLRTNGRGAFSLRRGKTSGVVVYRARAGSRRSLPLVVQ